MSDMISPVPSISIHQDDSGTVAGNFAVTESTVLALSAINWAALLQAIVAALPAIMAIIAAFSSTTAPPAPHEAKP